MRHGIWIPCAVRLRPCAERLRQTRSRVSKDAQPPARIWRTFVGANVVDAVEHNVVEMPVLEPAQIGRVAVVEFKLRTARPGGGARSRRRGADARRGLCRRSPAAILDLIIRRA